MIPTLGNGLLYRVHRGKPQMLSDMERKKAAVYVVSIFVCIVVAAFIWIIYR